MRGKVRERGGERREGKGSGGEGKGRWGRGEGLNNLQMQTRISALIVPNSV